MEPLLNVKSRAIGNRVSEGLGFDPITIITALLPLLLNCFKQDESEDSVKEYLEDRYDETTETYDYRLVERIRPRTRRAARKEGQRKLSRDQLDAITIATLEEARNTPDDELQQLLADS